MKCSTLIILCLAITESVFAQPTKMQELSLSQLFLWNNTTIFDIYSGARASNKTGSAWSYGTNAKYSLGLTKELFATIGVGYFNQRFALRRGFDFYEPNVVTRLFYTTKNYSYRSFNYFGGLGYQVNLKKALGNILPVNSEFRFSAIVNFYNSFQQEFDNGGYHDPFYGNPQTRNDNYQYGTSIQLKAGVVRPIYKKFIIGLDVVVPGYNRLRKDLIFKENPDEYHGVNFSIGSSINLIYTLKN